VASGYDEQKARGNGTAGGRRCALRLFVGAGSPDPLEGVAGCGVSLELAHEERSLVAALCGDDSERLEAEASG